MMILPTLDHLYADGLSLLDLEKHYILEDLPGQVRDWRTILGDLARLKAGWRPDDAILADAPSYLRVIKAIHREGVTGV